MCLLLCVFISFEYIEYIWERLKHSSISFVPYVWFGVGNEESIRFWKDICWGERCLSSSQPKLFRLSNQNGPSLLMLSHHIWMVTLGTWLWLGSSSIGKLKNLLGLILFSLGEDFISPILPDKRIWILESFEKFSCKYFFKATLPCQNFDMCFPAKKPVTPSRVKAFLWLVVLNHINTIDMIQRRPCMFSPLNGAFFVKKMRNQQIIYFFIVNILR